MTARPTLVFYHGWAFDDSVWDALAARLPDWPMIRVDAGYFGAGVTLPAKLGPVVAIGHSTGFMRLLAHWPATCVAAVSINGFARFCALPGTQGGTPPRMLDRMLTRFEQDPAAVVAQFRERCGAREPAPINFAPALAAGLASLRHDDRSAALDALPVPLLALASRQDEIVAPSLTTATFERRAGCELVWFEGSSHLLPWSEPGWCAQRIQDFIERVVAPA